MSCTLIAGIHGGLGNQLFCFANAYSLARKNSATFVLDTQSSYHKGNKYNARCMLGHFHADWQEATGFQRFIRSRARKHKDIKIILRLLKKNNYIFLLEKKSKSKYTDYNESVENLYLDYKNIYVNGLWQCEKYFCEYGKDLRKIFKIKTPVTKNNLEILKEISAFNSVAIHARNIPDLPHISVSNYSRQKLRYEEYYRKAINIVLNEVSNPHFYFFSDYHVWPEFIHKLPNINIVNWNNDQEDGAIQDFNLMSQCKHFVIGPSTFSWWAAWLGESERSIVCAPSNYKYQYSNNKSVLPERWISLE